MATIRRRDFVNSFLYEVQIRRKGVRSLTVSFGSEQEAKDWVRENEFKYLDDPKSVREEIEDVRLQMKWHRERNR